MEQRRRPFSLMGWAYFFVVVVLFFCDQLIKFYFQKNFLVASLPGGLHSYLSRYETLFRGEIFSGFWVDISLTYVRNTGAAWGLFGNLPESIRPYFFHVLTFVAIVFLFIFFVRSSAKDQLTRWGLVVVLGGAVGNFVDRLVLHYVVDGFHIKWDILGWAYDYPVFNFADCCVSIGVGIILLGALITKHRVRSAPPLSKAEEASAS